MNRTGRSVAMCGARDRYGARLAAKLLRGYRVASLSESEQRLSKIRATFEILDLVSHTATDDRLLVIGDDVVDTRCPSVVDAFTRMTPMLKRHGVRAVRLLGCGTATRDAGRRTMRDLQRLLQPIDVFGTVDFLANAAFDRHGLKAEHARRLIAASDL